MAGTYDFEIEQGATFVRTITWKNSAGILVDLTGYTARMQVRSTVAAPDVLLELTNANSRLGLGGAAGTVAIRLSAAETALISWRKGVYDLELVAPSGTVTRLLTGAVTVSFEVTR